MTSAAEHLGHDTGTPDACHPDCAGLDKYLSGPLCTRFEVRLRADGDGKPLRCISCRLKGSEK